MANSFLKSLPAYQGSKRRLLGSIFKLLPSASHAPHFIDCFLGGGSISLFAKSRGFEVWANDISFRSFVVGKALIENSKDKLSKEDILRLLVPSEKSSRFVQKKYPHVFIAKHCEVLDLALSNVQGIEGTKRYLLLLLLLKFMLQARPMQNFGARKIIKQIQEGEWEEMNQNFVSKAYLKRVNGHPLRMIEQIRKQINKGIFSNGKLNKAFQRDVFEFLPAAEGNCAYFDPPYQQTTSYEAALRPLDAILAGKEKPMQRSVFSGKGGFAAVEHMLSLATHIPHWVLSYGNQGGTRLEDLIRLMEKFKRHVRGKAIRLTHCPGLSSDEHRKNNLEYLVVGHD